MGETLIRWPVCAGAGAIVLALAACSPSAPPQAPPAPPVASQGVQPPLAGGPSPRLADAAAGAGDTGLAAPVHPVDEDPVPPIQQVSYDAGWRHDRRVVYQHHVRVYEHHVYDRRARELAIERRDYFAYRRYLAHERLRQTRLKQAHHWYYRHHHLEFAAPVHARGRYLIAPHHGAAPAAHVAAATRPAVKPAASSAPAKAKAARPAPHPAAWVRPHHSRILVEPTAKPVALQPSGPPALAQTTLALPLISPQPAPAATPAQAAAAPAVDLATQLGQLTTAVAEVMKGARLDVPPAISSGGEAKVVLTLPAGLLESTRASAAQAGLGPAARKVFVTARLAGQGYGVNPTDEQTARLQAGEPTVFIWDVKPSSTPGGVLTADMTGSLQGDGDDKTFALGAVTAQIPVAGQIAAAPAPIQAPESTSPRLNLKLPDFSHVKLGGVRLPDLSRLHLRDLAIPGHPTLNLPVLGRVASYKVVAAGILALILILLASIMRNARARRERAERRRRFHSFEANHFGDEHP
jgi:hypothetical protein